MLKDYLKIMIVYGLWSSARGALLVFLSSFRKYASAEFGGYYGLFAVASESYFGFVEVVVCAVVAFAATES